MFGCNSGFHACRPHTLPHGMPNRFCFLGNEALSCLGNCMFWEQMFSHPVQPGQHVKCDTIQSISSCVGTGMCRWQFASGILHIRCS
eukprot:5627961-Amphidinium_carterae.1